ncbi:MAG: ankyrin repeat domain-containing protein [Rickettsiales bacterium]|nr:ankyrin repeat domain-containing protein [Rickettsiales bacterium]
MRILNGILSFVSAITGRSTNNIFTTNTNVEVKQYGDLCFDRPLLPAYELYRPDDWCYTTYAEAKNEHHYSYIEHKYSNQIYIGNLIELKKIIQQGVDVNSLEFRGMPIIYHAVETGYPSSVKALIEAGADYKFKIYDEKRLIHIAALEENFYTMGALLKAHFSKNDHFQFWDFRYKMSKSDIQEIMQEVVDAKDKNNVTALIIASQQGNLNIVNLLLNYGANIDHVDGNGWSAKTIAESMLALLKTQPLKGNIAKIKNYEEILNLYNNSNIKENKEKEGHKAMQFAFIGLTIYFSVLYCLYLAVRRRRENSDGSISITQDTIQEFLGPFDQRILPELESKSPLSCFISFEELTTTDQVCCIDKDFKALYKMDNLINWINCNAKIVSGEKNYTFTNPLTNNKISIDKVYDVTSVIQTFLEYEQENSAYSEISHKAKGKQQQGGLRENSARTENDIRSIEDHILNKQEYSQLDISDLRGNGEKSFSFVDKIDKDQVKGRSFTF